MNALELIAPILTGLLFPAGWFILRNIKKQLDDQQASFAASLKELRVEFTKQIDKETSTLAADIKAIDTKRDTDVEKFYEKRHTDMENLHTRFAEKTSVFQLGAEIKGGMAELYTGQRDIVGAVAALKGRFDSEHKS